MRSPGLSLETKFALTIGSIVSLLIIMLFLWMSQRHEQEIMEQVNKQAKILWTQLVLTRQWVAENREIVLDVPAVVTKKLSRKAEDEGLYKFRITSLRLINPENAPNDFERTALHSFEERGYQELSRVEEENGVKVYRYMAPLYVTEACLQCHGYQGYSAGQVRGGLSVMIPMQEADSAIASNRAFLSISALVVLIAVLGAIYLLVRRMVLSPVHHLHAVAHQVEAGNYAVRSQVRTGDELEHLSSAFNRMLSAIVEAKSFDEAVLENVASGVLTVDRDGVLTSANRTASELFAHLRRGQVARLQRELQAASSGSLPDASEHGKNGSFKEMVLRCRDGRNLILAVTASPLRNADGAVVGAVGVVTDLTQVREMDEQKAHLDRLAALGKLSGSIAHEINNPLQSIISGLALVSDPECDPALRKQYAEIVREEVERISRIIQQMLDFYRPAKDGRAPTNVNALVQSVLTLVRKQLQNSGVRVTIDLDPELPAAVISASQVRQVVLNVVLNAIEAMPDGGELRVATMSVARRGDEPPRIAIKVADTGIGISRRQMRRIFDPFYTTKSGGTGLGLSISYGIVKGHGGTISVDSKEGAGTSFVVELPILGLSLGEIPLSDGQEDELAAPAGSRS